MDKRIWITLLTLLVLTGCKKDGQSTATAGFGSVPADNNGVAASSVDSVSSPTNGAPVPEPATIALLGAGLGLLALKKSRK